MAESDNNIIEKIDNVPDWIWEVNAQGVVTYSNNVVSQTLGYEPEQIVGRPLLDFVPQDEAGRCSEMIRQAIDEGRPIRNIVSIFLSKDNKIRTMEVSCVPISGEPGGLRGIARDLTERRHAQYLAEQVLEHSRAGVFILQDDLLVFVNPRICELMGYAQSEVLGTPIWRYVHPDDAGWLLERQVHRLAGKPVSTDVVARGITKTGDIRHYDLRISSIYFKAAPALLVNAVDITDAVHAREALARSEQNFRALVEKTSDWIWQTDENLVYTYASPRSKELFGYEPEEIVGKTMFDLMPAGEDRRVRSTFAQLLEEQKPMSMIENRMLHRDGHTVIVETSAEPIFVDEQLHGYRGIDRDITARKDAEGRLRKALSEMEIVFHAFPDIYFWLDTKGVILRYQASDMSELYLAPEDFMGKKMFKVLPKEAADKFREALREVVRTGSMVSTEYALDIGGENKYYEARLMPLPDNQVLVIIRNITQRFLADISISESREMLELVLANIPQYVFWKDTNLTYLGCNDNFARAAGVGSPENIVGKTDYDLSWTKEQADHYRKWDRQVIDGDKPALHIEEEQLRADGSEVWLDTNKVPLHNLKGEVVGILGAYEDITERRLAEQAIQEAEAKYRSLVEETMVGVYMIQNDRFVYANPRMLEIFGAKESDMLTLSPLHFVAPQDRAHVAENLRKRLSREVKTIRYAFKAVRMDGTPIDVEVHSAVIDYLGKPAIIGSLLDITERKRYTESLQESEERYRRLFEFSPDMVFLISGITGTFTAMNPAVTRVLGYAPYDVLGKSPGEISPEFQPNGKSSAEEADRLVSKQVGAPTQRFEWVHKKKDGTLVECEISLMSYRFHGEDLVQAIVRDISERKRAEENKRRLEQELDRQKRVFYRETILSVTGGKLDICDYIDVESYIVNASGVVDVEETSRVSRARREARTLLEQYGLVGERLDAFMIGVGEAITNAVKHGISGTVHIGHNDTSVWTVVSDKGDGIESLILPRAVLFRGFSTKPSLGLGYSIMLDVSDRILLSTGPQGTNVVLIKDKVESDLMLSTEFLPDTWDGIPG